MANTDDTLADQRRIDWLIPVIATVEGQAEVGRARTEALGAALLVGLVGRDAIDFAMEGSP